MLIKVIIVNISITYLSGLIIFCANFITYVNVGLNVKKLLKGRVKKNI